MTKALSVLAGTLSFLCFPLGAADEVEVTRMESAPDICHRLTALPILYRDKDNSLLNEFKLIARGQYQIGWVAPSGANRYYPGSHGRNDEWRRVYLGFDAKMFNNRLLIHNMSNVGQLVGMHRYRDGRWTRTRRDWSFYEFYVRYYYDDVAFTIGKIAPNITTDFRVSSSDILTVERTSLANQLDPDSNWGIQLGNPRKKGKWGWSTGVFLNGNGTNLNEEIHFDSEDSIFISNTVSYDATGEWWGDVSELSFSYAHNFTDYVHKTAPSDAYYAGPGARDIVAASWSARKGEFYLLTEFAAGFGITDRDIGRNVYGFYVIPSYRFTPNWEGVFRYQLAWGNNSVRVLNRYAPSVTTYPAVADSLNAFYLGLNYYFCGNNPALAKFMLGAEYTTTTVSGQDKPFDGWTYFAAFRFKF